MIELRFSAEKPNGQLLSGSLTSESFREGKQKIHKLAEKNQLKIKTIERKSTFLYKIRKGHEKPVAMGGGSNTFDGTGSTPNGTAWDVPAKLDTTGNGTYAAVVAAQQVTITGTPLDASYTWTVTTTVTPNNIQSQINE